MKRTVVFEKRPDNGSMKSSIAKDKYDRNFGDLHGFNYI